MTDMELSIFTPMFDSHLQFHRSSPYEHDQTAVPGHFNSLIQDSITFATPTTVVSPQVIPASTILTAHQDLPTEP